MGRGRVGGGKRGVNPTSYHQPGGLRSGLRSSLTRWWTGGRMGGGKEGGGDRNKRYFILFGSPNQTGKPKREGGSDALHRSDDIEGDFPRRCRCPGGILRGFCFLFCALRIRGRRRKMRKYLDSRRRREKETIPFHYLVPTRRKIQCTIYLFFS